MSTLVVVEALAGVTALVAAAAGLWRALHLGELLVGTRAFLADWQGDPPRPGYAGRPSVPERLANVEAGIDDTSGQVSGLAVQLGVLSERTEATTRTTAENRDALARLDQRVQQLDGRVTDHRRRNEAQAEQLRDEVERRLTHLTVDLTRAETYRAALVELGIDVEAPTHVPRRHHHRVTDPPDRDHRPERHDP